MHTGELGCKARSFEPSGSWFESSSGLLRIRWSTPFFCHGRPQDAVSGGSGDFRHSGGAGPHGGFGAWRNLGGPPRHPLWGLPYLGCPGTAPPSLSPSIPRLLACVCACFLACVPACMHACLLANSLAYVLSFCLPCMQPTLLGPFFPPCTRTRSNEGDGRWAFCKPSWHHHVPKSQHYC